MNRRTLTRSIAGGLLATLLLGGPAGAGPASVASVTAAATLSGRAGPSVSLQGHPRTHPVDAWTASADHLGGPYTDKTARNIVHTRVHAAGLRIFGGTMTRFKGAGYYSESKDAIRQQVNNWIRTSGEFDGVADFDRALRNPDDPQMFLPAYDSGDHLHPNDNGYHAMAAAVDLKALVGRP